MPTYPSLPQAYKSLVCVVATLVATACTNPFAGGDCVSLGVAAISATVVDATTNRAPVAGPVLRVEEGPFVEEHATPFAGSDPPLFAAAIERPGTYRVVVRAAGYQDYVRDNIQVTRGGHCNYLSGVRLTVTLARTM